MDFRDGVLGADVNRNNYRRTFLVDFSGLAESRYMTFYFQNISKNDGKSPMDIFL
jgi:hypothetical protein